ncbi:MAG: S1C family serine protease [Candidatus Zixiibacteriota bacterium]
MSNAFKHKKTAGFAAVFFSIIILCNCGVSGKNLETLDSELSSIIDIISRSVVTVEARLGSHRAPLYPNNVNALANPVTSIVGSGIVYDTAGHILTLQSLVEGFDYYQVEIDGKPVPAELVGIDHRLNLAVLRLLAGKAKPVEISEIPPLSGRLALAYGRSVGNTGFPSMGMIAGKHTDGNYFMSGTVLPGLLGGGVFDLSGQLIGLISAGNISTSDQQTPIWGGIVLIPAGSAVQAAERIINFGNNDAGYLGVRTTPIELVSQDGTVAGEAVVITDVAADSPAELAGLLTGDIITRFVRQNVTNDRQLQQMIASAGADSTVTIEFIRGDRHLAATVALTAQPQFVRAQNPSRMVADTEDILAAHEIQKRIDSMKVEMRRLQELLNQIIQRVQSPR